MLLHLPAPPRPPGPGPAARPGPVVVFLPAHDEEATVADVVARVPELVLGRWVEIRRMLPQCRLGNLALTGLLRFVARAPIGDGQSGFRALRRVVPAVWRELTSTGRAGRGPAIAGQGRLQAVVD